MSNYRRNREGRVYFFTVVTDQRRPILTTELGRTALREAIQTVQESQPFRVEAIVLLPDHMHTVWQLPANDVDYSDRWKRIKTLFSKSWKKSGGAMPARTLRHQRRGEQAIWQRRFFEHTCRDENDFARCIDYIHVNPLKHGLVSAVVDWPWSSFHRYVATGIYPSDWGNADEWYGDEFSDYE